MLLPTMWARSGSKDVLLLQRETVKPYACRVPNAPYDPEWDAVEKSFAQANTRVEILDGALRLGVPYRFVAQSKIVAENARLEREYPGWQGKPGATQYAAVSVVGFNRQRTRAMVYVRLRDQGEVHSVEKRDGRWVPASRDVCSWRA
jgi:hypothetical protein